MMVMRSVLFTVCHVFLSEIGVCFSIFVVNLQEIVVGRSSKGAVTPYYIYNVMHVMKKYILIVLMAVVATMAADAQERKVENRPYTDLRPFHFGILVGTHMQDMEMVNVGPQTIIAEDGTQQQVLISADQDRWDAGLNVGVLGEFRLSQNFQFRVAPALYFGNRHLTFHHQTQTDAGGNRIVRYQDLKSIYVSSALDLIFAAPRFNNHRPYIMAGINPMINLSGRDDDIVRLKRYDTFAEVGLGCDFYLPYFKLRPELKFMFSLINSLDTSHPDKLKDDAMKPFARSISETRTKMIVLTFYFE